MSCRHLDACLVRFKNIKLCVVKSAFLVAALLLCAPVARAQPATPPVPLARIDPAALNLLARMSWKYRNHPAYDTYIQFNDSRLKGKAGYSLIHFQTSDMGDFVLNLQISNKNWAKWIFDGSETLVGFNSNFPKRYTRQTVAVPVGDGGNRAMGVVLESIGFNRGTLFKLLSGDFPGYILSNPNLAEISMTDAPGAKVVTLGLNDGKLKQDDYIKLWVEPQTLVLQKTTSRITLFNGREPVETVSVIENYPHAQFNPQLSFRLFLPAAPLDYRLIDSFAPNIQPPVKTHKAPTIAIPRK